MKKLPKYVFLNWAEEGTRNEYLSVNEAAIGAAEMDETKRVGRYVLAEEMDVSGIAKIAVRKVAKRARR